MNDEKLSSMDTDELELFLSECAEKAEELNVGIDYYIAEFA